MSYKIRPIAIHLPQFHPIPENDAWWGKGFTEWTNVTKAKPLFKGHYQPHLPADLGFYDLRLEEARLAQEALAKQYGIYGFCYYHYWFNGKRMLYEPIQRKLKNPKEDLPFMLCWANENWTKAWDGKEKEVLIKQEYSNADDLEHIRFLIPFFKDERYIKIDGKPVFAVYRSTLLPDMSKTIKIWKEEALKHGVELYLCRFETFGSEGAEYLNDFDAAIEFPPHNSFKHVITLKHELSWLRLKRSFNYRILKLRRNFLRQKVSQTDGIIIDYSDFVSGYLKKYEQEKKYCCYHCVTPGWDNTARKKNGFVLWNNSKPEYFKNWIIKSLEKFKIRSADENLFFINAWNEWAEGNHMEPDQMWGSQYLSAFYESIHQFRK